MARSAPATITAHELAEAASSGDFAPVVLAFVVPVVGLVVALMRYQHVDSTRTRELIERTVRQASEESSRQFDLLRADIGRLGDGLQDARERLARIEGRLNAGRPQHDDEDGRDAA